MSSSVIENIESLEKILQKCHDCLEYYPKDYLNNFEETYVISVFQNITQKLPQLEGVFSWL